MRHRYIGFIIISLNGKKIFNKFDLINEIKTNCKKIYNSDYKQMGIYLTRFNGLKGIIRCNHVDKDKTLKLLKSINILSSYKIRIKTIGTSGTIKSLIRKYLHNELNY